MPLAPHAPSVETLPPPLPLPEHAPNPGWQPAPQWSVVLPQKPLPEQQSPNPDLGQVLLEPDGPQWPSEVTLPLSTHLPKSGWQPAPQWAAVAPQWAAVAPHHPLAEQQSP